MGLKRGLCFSMLVGLMLYNDPCEKTTNFELHFGDLTDSTNLIRTIREVQSDVIYPIMP